MNAMNAITSCRLRVAFVGAGYGSSRHLVALKGFDFVDVVIADLDIHLSAAQALVSQFGSSNAAPTLAELSVGKSNADYVLKLPASQRAPALDAIDLDYQMLVERRRAPIRRSCRSCIWTTWSTRSWQHTRGRTSRDACSTCLIPNQ